MALDTQTHMKPLSNDTMNLAAQFWLLALMPINQNTLPFVLRRSQNCCRNVELPIIRNFINVTQYRFLLPDETFLLYFLQRNNAGAVQAASTHSWSVFGNCFLQGKNTFSNTIQVILYHPLLPDIHLKTPEAD